MRFEGEWLPAHVSQSGSYSPDVQLIERRQSALQKPGKGFVLVRGTGPQED